MSEQANDPDALILAQLLAGDTNAFPALLDRYETKMYNLAVRYTGDYHEAYDLTQEIFIRLYRSLDQFRGDAKFSTWLYRIAINCCNDHVRSQQRVAIPDTLIHERIDRQSSVAQLPEHQLEQAELQSQIAGAIDALPPTWRDAIILREWEGLSYAEISAALETPEGTIKSWIHRGRQLLREQFRALQLFPSTRVQEIKGGEVR